MNILQTKSIVLKTKQLDKYTYASPTKVKL